MSWRRARDFCDARQLDIGVMIFANILSVHPELKQVFHIDHNLTIDKLGEDHPFRRHARVFVNIIDLVVSSILFNRVFLVRYAIVPIWKHRCKLHC
jgi:hypothetical protein